MKLPNVRNTAWFVGLCGFAMGATINDASAEILLAKTRTQAAIYGGATYLVDFNGAAAGGTEYTFTTAAANTRVILTFNAECAVEGNPTQWLDIDIVVDPAGATGETAAPPSDSDNALCSGNETPSDFLYASGDGWVSASTQATIVLPQAGTHKVKVRVNGSYTGGIARLDDMSLVIMR